MERALTVYYDGDCGFCERSVGWALARDRAGILSARKAAMGLPPEIPKGLEARTVILWDPERRTFWTRAEAVAGVLLRLPRWRLVGRLLLVPGVRHLAGLGYDWVAANRLVVSRWLGTPACSLPDPAQEEPKDGPARRSERQAV